MTSTDPEKYVKKNREKIIRVVQSTNDPSIRAYAWALLDRYTPNNSLDELHDELDEILGDDSSP
ncbi:hypothetical protein [Haladaptatus sp. YSMS36]|uniref:hypothetical protein n=1 Tax=Haladaptatus sp. YSMS36 TaxID=3033384 RepID=UPI0023E8AC53|nr:hypothetical protein [Haladaptatus sp. YSMS36]